MPQTTLCQSCNFSRPRARTSSLLTRVWLAILLCCFSTSLLANSGGIINRSMANNTCNRCHGGGSLSSAINLQGATVAAPGELLAISVVIATSNRSCFNLSTSAGNLTAGFPDLFQRCE